jgi:hypothetical protein
MAGIERIEVAVVRPDELLELFRVCRGDAGETFVESFVSSYERGSPPRGWEARNVLIQMGLSTFWRREQAEATARRFPVIGDHVARLVLRHGSGFAYARTGSRGHVTIWGRPLQLVEAVADITPIEF